MYPKQPEDFIEYCRELNYNELLELICMVEASIVAIQNINDNNRNVSDDSLARSEGALRWELWRLRTARTYARAKKPHPVADHFIDIARKVLPADTFQGILSKAKANA